MNTPKPSVEALQEQVQVLTALVKSLAEAVSLVATDTEALKKQVLDVQNAVLVIAGPPKKVESEQLPPPPEVIIVNPPEPHEDLPF